MGWNGGGISARVVSRRRFNRHYFEIFEGQSKCFGDRLRRSAAFGHVAGHSPLSPPPLCHCNFECFDGLTTRGGGVDRLSSFVTRGSIWCFGLAFHTDRYDHCSGYYHHAGDCLNHPPSHARALVRVS